MRDPKSPATIAATNGIAEDSAYGAVAPPIHLSSAFAFEGFGRPRGAVYTRFGNPTRNMLADTVAKLEGGAGAVVTASGMAAVDLVLSTLSADQLVVVPHDCYGGTQQLLALRKRKRHFDVALVDQTDPEALASALDRRPALVLVETPSNPLMRVVDIRAIAQQAEANGAKLAVDNTFLSPALQTPIALGADFVIHSTTKYLNGHSDVVGGVVVATSAEDHERLAKDAIITGVVGAPFDAYLTLRGIRSLFPRIQRQQATAARVADFLATHPAIKVVHYPGLTSHAGHAIAKAQQRGFGAMLSFELAAGPERVPIFLEALEVCTLAVSLGGVESLIAHPATMTHCGMSSEERCRAGISDALLRLSVGLEEDVDLLADLDAALRLT